MSVYLLPPLPSSSKSSCFLCRPAICPLVRPPARRHHISVTPASLPPFDLRHPQNMIHLHPYPPPPSQSQSYLFLSIYLSPLNHFLSPLSLTHSLSLFHSLCLSISPQLLSLPASYSLSHYIFLNYPFSHYLFSLYLFPYSLSHTHTLSSFSRASISVTPCNKIYRGADLLPLAIVNRIYRDDGIRSVLLARIRSSWLGSVWITSLSTALYFSPLDLIIFLKITYH